MGASFGGIDRAVTAPMAAPTGAVPRRTSPPLAVPVPRKMPAASRVSDKVTTSPLTVTCGTLVTRFAGSVESVTVSPLSSAQPTAERE